jgi:hypothetical protein
MITSEQTLLKNAIDVISACFGSSSLVQQYLTEWKNDVDALTNSASGDTELTSGKSFKSVRVCAYANRPTSPAANDEFICTDASATTNGSTLAGGGSNRVMAKYSSPNWVIV